MKTWESKRVLNSKSFEGVKLQIKYLNSYTWGSKSCTVIKYREKKPLTLHEFHILVIYFLRIRHPFKESNVSFNLSP